MKKTIIISGARGNLGHATVKLFLEKGYTVIATVSKGNLLGFMDEHESLKVYEVDATNPDSCNLFIDKVVAEFNRIDCVLLLVGGFASGNLHTTKMADFEKQLQLNFATAFNIAQPVFEKMALQPTGGKIIFIGSKPGLSGKEAKESLAYGLSKSLVFRLAEVINAEGKKKNITASVIVPGTMDTPANRKEMPDADFSTWVSPGDVAAAMEFICSDNGTPLRETVLKIYGNT